MSRRLPAEARPRRGAIPLQRALAALSLAGLLVGLSCGGDAHESEYPRQLSAPRAARELSYRLGRVIALAGQPIPTVSLRERPSGSVSVSPALPPGLSLDPATGAISGVARAAAAGQLYEVRDAQGGSAALWIEIVAPPEPARSRFVAPNGDDSNPGTIEQPFRTVARGVAELRPGMTLFLRGGTYRESVEIAGLQGAPDAPIEIRSYPGERAVIDASLDVFADDPERAWRRPDEPAAHPDEWVSVKPLPADREHVVSRGAFLDLPGAGYTRLLTYSRIEDLRAENQLWSPIGGGDPRPGPRVLLSGKAARNNLPPRRPWTYFGPGIQVDPAGRVHIRLSPTRHGVSGLAEYTGPSDPRRVRLALSTRSSRALDLRGVHHLRLVDLGLNHGGEETVRIRGSSDVLLDHVSIRAATYGLAISHSERITVRHARIDGGIPPWSFRSDFKANYSFVDESGATVVNNLVRKTQRALLYMGPRNRDIEIAYCELENGHDVYLSGHRTDFHHNRIRNVHDEALFLLAFKGEQGMRIHHNVIERALSGLSFSGDGAGARYVYRNLIDLREPTAGHRPTGEPGHDPWRYGHPFKNTARMGSLYFYQNTVLVSRPRQTALLHWRGAAEAVRRGLPRWFLNNLFLIVQPGPDYDRPVSFVPPSALLTARQRNGAPLLRSDGNLWVRVGRPSRPLFRCVSEAGYPCDGRRFARLPDLLRTGGFRRHGFEASSRQAPEPGFRRAQRLDLPSPRDDLRPAPNSPARRAGAPLPPELPGSRSAGGVRPDIGALAADAPPWRVGVDGALVY